MYGIVSGNYFDKHGSCHIGKGIEEIKQSIKSDDVTITKWLRSAEVRKLLKISPGTLQNLRIKGTLPYEKIGGTFYYAYADIVQLMGEIGNS